MNSNIIPFPDKTRLNERHGSIGPRKNWTDGEQEHFVTCENGKPTLPSIVSKICYSVFRALEELQKERKFLAKEFDDRDIARLMSTIRVRVEGATEGDYMIAADIANLLLADREVVWVDRNKAPSIVIEPKGGLRTKKPGLIRGGKAQVRP